MDRWDRSAALELRFAGTVHWVTAAWAANGVSSSGSTEANDGWADFRAWVADQATANNGGESDDGYPDLVFVDEDGRLVPHAGVRLLEQRADLGFPPNFAPVGSPTAAAHVERDGVRYLVLYRVLEGESDLIAVPATGHGSSLADLLEWARGRYASEEGVR